MENLNFILQEYVATANNPNYKGDYSIINSKFPELANIDSTVLQEYVLTANNPQYNQDWDLINSKFPEFNIESQETKHITQEVFDKPKDLGFWSGYEKELVTELKHIYPNFKFEEAAIGTDALKITPSTKGAKPTVFYLPKDKHRRWESKAQGFSTSILTRENVIHYIESNMPEGGDKTSSKVFLKSGLTSEDYPVIKVGLETQSYMGNLVEVPIHEQASAEKTDEIISLASGEYRKILKKIANESEQNILRNWQKDLGTEERENVDRVSNQVRKILESKGIFFESDDEWAKFVGLGGETYGVGLFGNILEDEATIEENAALATNIAESSNLSSITDETRKSVEQMVLEGYTKNEIEKRSLEIQRREKFNTLQKIEKTEENKTAIETLEDEIALLDNKILKLGEKIGGEEGEKIKTRSFIDENSKWRHEQIQKYRDNSQSDLNRAYRKIKHANPEISDQDAWDKVNEAKILHLQKLWAEGQLRTVNITLDKIADPQGYAGQWEMRLYKMLEEKGYLPENYEYGDVIQVPVKDMFDANVYSGNFKGFWDKLFVTTALDDESLDILKQYETSIYRTKGELSAIDALVNLNSSPEAYERTGHGFNVALKGMITHFTDIPEYEADKIVGKGRAHTDAFMLDRMQEVASIYNTAVDKDMFIDESGRQVKAEYLIWTDEQAEAFQKSLAEDIGEGVGHFVPMLVELGAYTAVSGGILGIPRLALALNTMRYGKLAADGTRTASAWGKLGYHATMMAVEEVKMAAAGFTPGTGAAFYGGGVLTRGWSPFKRGAIFNKRFGYMEPVYQKVIKAGPVGAVSSQLANVASLAYQDLMDNKDFKTVFDAMYGDLDQTAKDILVESIVFSIVGGTHLKGVRRDPISGKIKRGVDLMTTTEKEVAIQSIIEKQNEILAKRAKSKQGKLTKKQAWEIIDRGFQGEGLKFFEGKPEGYENLTNKQREKYDALEHGKQAIQKMQDVIDMAIDLDPRNEKFEENADRMVFKPAEEAIKAVVPEWKGFEVRYESNPNMYRNKGAVAEFVEGGGKEGKDLLLFNKNHYTPGKSIHEIAHAALRAKFSENAEFKMNFDRKFVKKFGEFEFGEFKGTELYKWISENYGTPVYEVVDGKKRHKTDPKTGEKEYNFDGRLKDVNNLRGEEFLMYMTELLADPKIYKQVVAKNIFLEMKNEFQDMYEETFGKRPKIRTAKEFVAMLGRMSQSARRGLDFSTKLQAMTDLDKMDFRVLEYEVNRDKKIEKEIGLSSRELKKDALRKQKEFEKKEKDDLFKKSNDKLDNILKDYYNIEGFSKMNKEQQAKEWGKIPADQKLVVGYMLGNTWKKFAEMKADINYGNMGSLWTTKRAEFIEKLTTGIEKEQNGLPYLLRSWKPEESKLTSYIYGNLTKRFGHTQRTIEGFGEQMVGMEKAGDIPTGTPTAVKIKTNKIDKNLDIAEKSQGIKLKNHKFEIDGKEKKFSKESIENIDKANEAAFIETKEGELTFMQITPKAEKATIKEINNFLGITPGMKPARRAEIMNDFIKNNPEIAYDMILEPYTKDFKKIRMYETSESARTIFGRFMREIKDPEGKIQKFTYAEMPPTLPKKTRASQPVKREKIPANEKILDEFVKLMTEGRDATTLGKKHELFKTMWAKNFNSQSIRELRTNSEARKRISKTEQGRKNLEKLEMEETLAKVKGPMDVALATKLLDGMEKAFRISPELAKNIFVDHALNMRKAENAKYHRFIDSFKDYEWYFKNPKEAAIWAAIESKAKEGEVGKFSFVKDFNRHWDNFKGELPYGLTGKDIKGINSRGFISKDKGNLIVDVSRLKDFLRITEKFGEYLPKEAKESLVFLDQILGLHYRITLEGMNDFVRYVSNYKAKSPKGETKSFTEKQWKEMDTKGWEIIEKPGDVKGFVLDKKGKPITDQSLVGVRERILKVLGKNTYEGFKDIKSWKIKSAATQAEGQKKMAEAGDNYVKQLEIAEKYFSEYDNQTKKELSFNIESAKEQFIKDAKNKKEALERIEWVYQIIRANSNLRMGLRQTVPVEWIYMPGEKVTGEKIKLEHMKSMIEHGTQSGHLIATGKFRETGKDITSDFIGVTSVKKLLDIVDNAGGTTNTSGLYRMALLDPMTLMDFKSAKDPKKTMYQAIMDMANKELFNGKINQQLKIEKNVEKNIDKLLKPALSSKNLSRGEKEKAIKIIDNAVDVGRERNKTRKGGSFWDLDDTLFRTKSGVRYTLPNPSGKPAPQKKVIFMAGGPGSGKSTVIKGLGLEKQGFKIVNQDISLEWLMKNHGLPKDMRDFTPEQASKFGELGWEARMIAKRKQTKFQGRGDGIIVDGTGNSLKTMQNQVREFKNKGYDVQMLFVETSLETALQRNKARKERSLRSGIVKRTHESVQKNKQAFIDMFGKNFTEIKTDNLKQGDPIPKDVVSKMDAYTKGYKKGRFTAEEFAIEGERILAEGGKFDFSEFDYIKEGTEGPLFNKAMERAKKFGTEDTYILTARPHAAKVPIFRFLEARGLKIPFKNIITLENSAPEAKALEIAKKIGEGYNDIYFADDVLKNVQAVKNIMDQFDIKGKVQQAMASLNINAEINRRMEHSLGIDSKKTFTRAEAKVRGKDIKRRRFFMTDSASDLELLIEPLYGKGKKGIENKKWLDKNFIDPFERGIRDYNTARQNAKIDYMSLRKQNKDIVKKINKPVEGTSFTHDMAMRVYLWNKAGYKIPDLAKTTEIKLVEYIKNNPKLQAYAESFARMTKIEKGLKEPSAQWWAETMAGEISNVGRGVNRKQYLQEWIDIKNEMFSPKNLNKMESKLGTNWRENIEDIFDRMETGRTRSVKLDKGSAMMIDYLNGSTGTIMNFNTRSAALQTISTLNFLNMRENNPIAAARAMGNAPQFAKDFMKIMNSDMLKQRRDGLQINVSEAELASAAATSKNPITSIIAKILKVGYTPTKLADSFAISFGGATYYRNRIKMYEKQGLSAKEAEAKAWTDFQKLSERTQQSSRPDLLSKQQTTIAGRLILPFANTPMQMNRRGTKEILDISKGRYKNIAELGEKMGKITYYMGAQVALFAGLQSALFAMLLNDDDVSDEKIEKTKVYTANTVADSFLRGMGIPGAVAAGFKNATLEYFKQSDKGYKADYAEVAEDLLNISPLIGSKYSALDRSGDIKKWDKDVPFAFELGNPKLEAAFLTTQALTNIPLQSWHQNASNIQHSLNTDYETWQRIHMMWGFTPYNVGIEFEKKKETKKRKSRKTRGVRKTR